MDSTSDLRTYIFEEFEAQRTNLIREYVRVRQVPTGHTSLNRCLTNNFVITFWTANHAQPIRAQFRFEAAPHIG